MGHFHGQLCERRRILPLQLLGYKRVRQDRAGGYLCSGLPANVGSAHVWHFPATEEDEAYEDHTDVVQEVELFFLLFSRRSGQCNFMLMGTGGAHTVQIEPSALKTSPTVNCV